MNWTAAFQLATAVIASLGGGGALVYGLSGYLGRLWADRALEHEKHEYAQLLQTAKSQLDQAASRYQVELDALRHVHELRTDEEFRRLGQLWKQLAILGDLLRLVGGQGFQIVPEDPGHYKEYKKALRKQYEEALLSARSYFLEEKLFIPAQIADVAQSALGFAIREKNLFDLFADHHEPGVRHEYTANLPGCAEGFRDAMERLERMMRGHIEGRPVVSDA